MGKPKIDLERLSEEIRKNPLMSASDFAKKYGVKIWTVFKYNKELHEYWKSFERQRRSLKMKGNKNGCRPPTILVDKDKLITLINKGATIEEMKQFFGIGERLLLRNIEYYKLWSLFDKERFSRFTPFVKEFLNKLSKSFPELLKIPTDNPDDDLEFLRKLQRNLLIAAFTVKVLGIRIRDRLKVKNFSFSTNIGEVIIEEILNDMGIHFTRNFILHDSDRKYIYDFYIPKLNLILEINGSIHRAEFYIEKDKKRKKLAESLGYNFEVIEIPHLKSLHKLDEEVLNVIEKYRV